MNTAALREQISRAHQHESSTGQLAQQLEVQLPHLHPAIALPDVDAKGVMTRFVSAYIDQVPDLLDAANDVAREAGIESQIKPSISSCSRQRSWPGMRAWTVCWTRLTWRIGWWKRSTICISSTSASR